MDENLYELGDNDFNISLHRIITELSNISELSQLMKFASDKETFEKYLGMMRDLSDNAIRIIMKYMNQETLV